MTIASAFNDIAVAQGGTASKSGTITGALDALTDALAGSDQPAPQTIEQGVRMLGEHIGGGGGGGEITAENAVYVQYSGQDDICLAAGTLVAKMKIYYKLYKWNDGEGTSKTEVEPIDTIDIIGDLWNVYRLDYNKFTYEFVEIS